MERKEYVSLWFRYCLSLKMSSSSNAGNGEGKLRLSLCVCHVALSLTHQLLTSVRNRVLGKAPWWFDLVRALL